MRWPVVLSVVLACSSSSDPPRPQRVGKVDVPVTEPFEISSSSTAKLPRTVASMVASGTYWHLATAHGPVHVWVPKGYDARRAETIVYLHGYYIHADEAWTTYDLASQFASSAINAMFIVPEAPATYTEPVAWDGLAPLLVEVARGIGQPTPHRRIVAFGHSAGYRTLLGWLDEAELDTVVLFDAAYGEIDQYRKWIEASDRHRLIDVGDDTRTWTDQLHASLPDTVVLDGFPTVEAGIPAAAARARILYIKSDLGHFPMVTNGTAIPTVLRALRAKRLLREPLAEIIAN
jgi:hypothetical protein